MTNDDEDEGPARGPREVKAPKRRDEARNRRRLWMVVGVVGGALLVGAGLYAFSDGRSSGTSEGLPNTPDYHSLLVSPQDPETVPLGTHDGLWRTQDGGRTWAAYQLAGQDAMNLARAGSGGTVWTAGHLVLAKSTDGGETWTNVRPETLPSLDVHGFAIDPRDPTTPTRPSRARASIALATGEHRSSS